MKVVQFEWKLLLLVNIILILERDLTLSSRSIPKCNDTFSNSNSILCIYETTG